MTVLLAVMQVLLSGGGTPSAARYFPTVAREMGFEVSVAEAHGDLETALRARDWRVVVVAPEEATAVNLALIRRLATNAVPHVESAAAKGWTTVPVGKARELFAATESGKAAALTADEADYLRGCTYLATLTPADMIQLLWWPKGMDVNRAQDIRIAAEKAASGGASMRSDDAPQAEKAKCVTWERLNAAMPDLKPLGVLATRDSKDIASSMWSVGCETMDRGYATFRNYSGFVGGTGAKHARLQSGWERTEKTRGTYDFAWLDEHVRGLAAQGVKPWICICYGNPIYNSTQRMRWAVSRITEDPEGFPAWIRYVEALVARYRDVVDTWEVWNEPFFRQVPFYTKLLIATSDAVRRLDPKAKVWASSPGELANCRKLLAAVAERGRLDAVDAWVYHPYCHNPDAPHDELKKSYDWGVATSEEFRRLVKGYDPRFEIVQGECGCPAQLEFSHALNNWPWTEQSQAKWNLRSMLGAAARGTRFYSVFAMIDFQYTDFMLQSFGLLRADLAKEVVYRRPLYYACRNVFSFFDDTVKACGFVPASCEIVKWADANERGVQRHVVAAKFGKGGDPVAVLWYDDRIPGDSLGWDTAKVALEGIRFEDPVWTDLVTGRTFELASFDAVPLRDSPVMVCERRTVELKKDGTGR